MATRSATAEWKGGLREGDGSFDTASGAVGGKYSFESRFTEEGGTNPEELIAAAQAGCYSMQLAAMLEAGGQTPESVRTEAKVQILKEGDGFAIKKIAMTTVARVPGIDDAAFQETVRQAKEACLISQALGAVETITVDATLES
ncbi:MAG TPA: OsmC family peroxiredoxin [Solirubrobacteraceae bacterium]|jgi:osmotically inducible protein OsmC|nr:OsmC family peroxiredoxin [Solirubrobacteraceae bacterium]